MTGPKTGGRSPLAKHGAGTQSLSVIFLFQAFLEADLGRLDKLGEPILGLEEPEAHLHPAAIRSLWSAMNELKGQKLIATHSGDLLSQVPLANIRRFRRVGGKIEVCQLKPGSLVDEDLRKIHFHVRRTRGELLFARCWLLGEGETEYWVFSQVADIIKIDLEREGIRFVDYSQAGVVPFTKLADDMGIEWHAVVDGDAAGRANQQALRARLGGRPEPERVSALPQDNMELFLCKSGYGIVYKQNISPQLSKNLTAKRGDPDYWKQVLNCQSRTPKPTLAIEVMRAMQKKGKRGVPKLLAQILKRCSILAAR